jgi:hypothetical protein
MTVAVAAGIVVLVEVLFSQRNHMKYFLSNLDKTKHGQRRHVSWLMKGAAASRWRPCDDVPLECRHAKNQRAANAISLAENIKLDFGSTYHLDAIPRQNQSLASGARGFCEALNSFL